MNWTERNMPDLTGKEIIVTGGNSGLGFESVKAFAKKGAKVILASRSYEKGEEARKAIIKEVPQGNIQVRRLDLGDLDMNFADGRYPGEPEEANFIPLAPRLTSQGGGEFPACFRIRRVPALPLPG